MNLGMAPTLTIDSVVDTKVCPTVSTSSPVPRPSAFKAQVRAFVPDPMLAQSSAPVYSLIALSNLSTVGPVIKSDRVMMSAIAESMSPFTSSY